MKIEKMIALLLCTVLMATLSGNALGSEEPKIEKETSVKFIADVKGENVKWDTTITTDGEKTINITKYLKKRFPSIDTSDYKYVSVSVSSECDDIIKCKKLRKPHVFHYNTTSSHIDDDGLVKVVIESIDSLISFHKICDELVVTADIADDIYLLKEKLSDLKYEIHTDIDEELEHKISVKVLSNIAEHMDDVDFLLHDGRKSKLKHFDFHKSTDFSIGFVLDNDLEKGDIKKLKNFGHKMSDEKLNVEHVYVYSGNDDLFKIKFELDTEGKTTIKIYSESGEELFSDKVVYFPGIYNKKTKIKLEDKGVYYIYIEQNGKTFATKLKLD